MEKIRFYFIYLCIFLRVCVCGNMALRNWPKTKAQLAAYCLAFVDDKKST